MTDDIIRVDTLSKQYGVFKAVDRISFTVYRGEIVGLLGPNGAGKTTTISMLLGLLTPTGGTIRIFGKDIAVHRTEVLQDMNYSSAYVKGPWRMTAWEHVYVFARLYEVSDPKKRADEMLEAFHLTSYRNMLCVDLSSGNMARLNLAKAFVNQPKLVLLDEPTSSVDPDIADRVRQFIARSRKQYNTTILLTSHNMAEIEELCDRVIFMNHGKIIAQDTPEGLARKIQKTRLQLMMRDGQKRTVEYCTKHNLDVTTNERYVTIETKEQDVALVLMDLSKIGADYTQISIEKPTLEDYFIGEARHEH